MTQDEYILKLLAGDYSSRVLGCVTIAAMGLEGARSFMERAGEKTFDFGARHDTLSLYHSPVNYKVELPHIVMVRNGDFVVQSFKITWLRKYETCFTHRSYNLIDIT